MKISHKILLAHLIALIILSLAVVTNYKLNLVFETNLNALMPAIIASIVLIICHVIIIKQNKITLSHGAFLMIMSIIIFLFTGGFVWIYSACVMGDCL